MNASGCGAGAQPESPRVSTPAVAAAMSRLDELGAQVAELKRRVESAEVKKLGRTG